MSSHRNAYPVQCNLFPPRVFYSIVIIRPLFAIFIIEMSRYTNASYIKTSMASDEDLEEFVRSCPSPSESEESDGEDFDDSIDDPDFDPRDHEISPEDEELINQHIDQVGNTAEMLADAVNLSLNLSNLDFDLHLPDIPAASSTLNAIQNVSHEEIVETVRKSFVNTIATWVAWI